MGIVAQEKTSVGKVRKLCNFGSSVLGPQFKLCLALKSYRIAKPSTLPLNNFSFFVLLFLFFSTSFKFIEKNLWYSRERAFKGFTFFQLCLDYVCSQPRK